MYMLQRASVLLVIFASPAIFADTFPKVDTDLAEYDAAIQKMKDTFAKIKGDSSNKDWVKKALSEYIARFKDICK
jgi:outer membrane lipoprotein-sorting protein